MQKKKEAIFNLKSISLLFKRIVLHYWNILIENNWTYNFSLYYKDIKK